MTGDHSGHLPGLMSAGRRLETQSHGPSLVFKVLGFGLWVLGFGFRVLGLRCSFSCQGFGSRVKSLGFRGCLGVRHLKGLISGSTIFDVSTR